MSVPDIQLEAISIVLGPNLHLYNAYLEIKKDADRYRFLCDWLRTTKKNFDEQIDVLMVQKVQGEIK